MADITLATFQAGDFNVKNLIEGLMDEDVRRARLEGGGESHFIVTGKTASSVQLFEEVVGQIMEAAPYRHDDEVANMAELNISRSEAGRIITGEYSWILIADALYTPQLLILNLTFIPSNTPCLSSYLSGKPMQPNAQNWNVQWRVLNVHIEETFAVLKLDLMYDPIFLPKFAAN